jgi:Uma2 family endonuclease
MAMRALVGQQLTAEEFLALPLDEYRFTQLIDGEIVVSEPLLHHQRVTGFIKALTSPQLPGFSLPVQELLDR